VPEGHTLHRLARRHQQLFGGAVVRAGSPQGRFADGAALLDGHVLRRAEAYGKHLFHHYEHGPLLHVHLGLYGKFLDGAGEPPAPIGAVRLRLTGNGHWADLRGATVCEVITPSERRAVLARLGPDPLRRTANDTTAFARISRSRTGIGALLMDQTVIAGVGNVYRAELLYRHRISPFRPGVQVAEPVWREMWTDLRALMAAGVRTGQIVTVRAADRPRKRGPLHRDEAGYVYRRAGLPCRVCGTEVRTQVLAGRNLFWCPTCQTD
jgi:endonuclease-8